MNFIYIEPELINSYLFHEKTRITEPVFSILNIDIYRSVSIDVKEKILIMMNWRESWSC